MSELRWKAEAAAIVDFSEIIHMVENDVVLSAAARCLGKQHFIEFFSSYIVTETDPWSMRYMTTELEKKLEDLNVSGEEFIEKVTDFHMKSMHLIRKSIPHDYLYSFDFAGHEVVEWLDSTTALIVSNYGHYIH